MRIEWNQESLYDCGVEKGVLYFPGAPGIPWNGLVNVDEESEKTIDTTRYFDGVRYAAIQNAEDFKALVTAYTYPPELDTYRGEFGFSYRTQNIIHLVYATRAHISNRQYTSKGEVIDPSLFQWDIFTKSTVLPGMEPLAHLIVDVRYAYPSVVSDLEDILYGAVDVGDATLPSMGDLIAFFAESSTMFVLDNGDGSLTISGPDEMVYFTSPTEFTINSPSLVYEDEESFSVSSY